jgi:hypothetical protein
VASQLTAPGRAGAKPADRGDAAPPATNLTSGYKLRPVTPVSVPALAASEWDDAELGPAVDTPLAHVFTSAAGAPGSDATRRPTGPLLSGTTTSTVVAYRWFLSLLVRGTTWISETSYTVSFILIILAIASGMVGRHTLASMCVTAIIIFNLVGLAGDLASLVTLSFRKNPLRGALFFVPPFTVYYLWSDWPRYRDTIDRMRIPLMTLALVAAAYLFVPWLRGGKEAAGPFSATVARVTDTLQKNLGGVRAVVDDGLKAAKPWLREVPLPLPSSPPNSDGATKPDAGQGP